MNNIQDVIKMYVETSHSNRFLYSCRANNGHYYMTIIDMIDLFRIFGHWIKFDVSSESNGLKTVLRIIPDGHLRIKAREWDLIPDSVIPEKGNKGRAFESYIRKLYGLQDSHDSIPYEIGSDAEINGERIQIKAEKATFASVEHILRAWNEKNTRG